MDWVSLAYLLAERSDKPLVLLDKSARVQMFSGAMERTLGWRRYEVEGRCWVEACVPPETTEVARKWLADALRGALRNYECEVVTPDGQRVLLSLEMSLIGRGREQGLLLTVQSVASSPSTLDTTPCPDLNYEILTGARDFGTLQKISCVGAQGKQGLEPPRRCFEALHGRKEPCPDCPASNTSVEAWPRISVRRKEKAEGFEVVIAEAVDPMVVRVNVRSISEKMLTVIHEAKIKELALRAKLSDRERAVLRYLVMGRSLEDIGKILDVAVRTVKFHQANVLEKLGADSRMDLVRLVI